MFGGMVIQVMTVFVVPLFQAMWRENAVRNEQKHLAAMTLNNGKEKNHV